MNKLFYGDNLEVLREHIADESVDLVYLDPPFNSKRAYNIIFKDKEGKFPPSQIQAFDANEFTDGNSKQKETNVERNQ
jgi:adenine specific DNA methylase Mod